MWTVLLICGVSFVSGVLAYLAASEWGRQLSEEELWIRQQRALLDYIQVELNAAKAEAHAEMLKLAETLAAWQPPTDPNPGDHDER